MKKEIRLQLMAAYADPPKPPDPSEPERLTIAGIPVVRDPETPKNEVRLISGKQVVSIIFGSELEH